MFFTEDRFKIAYSVSFGFGNLLFAYPVSSLVSGVNFKDNALLFFTLFTFNGVVKSLIAVFLARSEGRYDIVAFAGFKLLFISSFIAYGTLVNDYDFCCGYGRSVDVGSILVIVDDVYKYVGPRLRGLFV